jgi:two-component system, OmpR family, KDP operon response regulator KdpE
MTKAKILIIDDEATIRKFLDLTLSAQGYALIEAKTASEGIEEAIARRPDLVILDLSLPDDDGLNVLKKLREWSPIPIIVLTVRDSDSDKVALLDAGADDYLTKPFSVPELLARVRAALRHGLPLKEGELFIVGPLSVNIADRNVKVDGKDIKLTVTEFDLLKVLIRHAGKVVTQRQLLKEVWGPNSVDHSHYLRIYIAQLRKKLDFPELSDLITTEPGVGYRLKV